MCVSEIEVSTSNISRQCKFQCCFLVIKEDVYKWKWKSLRCAFQVSTNNQCAAAAYIHFHQSIYTIRLIICCINMGNQCKARRKKRIQSQLLRGSRAAAGVHYTQAQQLHSEANGMPSSGKLTESRSGGIMRQARAVYNIII
jgi:hypothetical protein